MVPILVETALLRPTKYVKYAVLGAGLTQLEGMYGGKILGAGGGGYFLFISNSEKKKSIKKVLNSLEEVKFNFSKKGCEVVYNDQVW